MVNGRLPYQVSNLPVKVPKAIHLKNKIRSADAKDKLHGICSTEMSQLFLCLKQFSFNQEACAKEIESFQSCYNKHAHQRLAPSAGSQLKSTEKINALLKKYS